MNLVPYVGGVLGTYFECGGKEEDMPPKLQQLVECLNNHEVPPEWLIKYSASPMLWVGMQFDLDSFEYAFKHDNINYIKWFTVE